jgi:thiamine pyrophosphate-dependent acetolactate synthase large subunit-like protein
MARTVADQFADILVAAGVKRLYGIVGGSLNGLTDALRRQGKIEWIHVRHEEVTAFYRQFYPRDRGAKIAQVDVRGEVIGRRVPVDLGVVGDVRATIEAAAASQGARRLWPSRPGAPALQEGPRGSRRARGQPQRQAADPSPAGGEGDQGPCERRRGTARGAKHRSQPQLGASRPSNRASAPKIGGLKQ